MKKPRSTIGKLTRIHWHQERRYAYSKRYGSWLVWHDSDIHAVLSGWLPTTYQPSTKQTSC
jgi:hypothetical protein